MKKLTLLLMMSIAAGTALFAQAPDMEVCVGKGYTLTSTAAAEGAEPITYQWYENSSPIGSGTPALAITAGQTVANNYTYVRVASNADCPTGVSSNAYTVQVRAAGAAGEAPDAKCDCAEGLIDCSGTCTTPHPTSADGDCVTGGCRQRTVNYYTECGIWTGSGTRNDPVGCPNPAPILQTTCRSNKNSYYGYSDPTQCREFARQDASVYCALTYDSAIENSECVTYYCK
jgi:hypothetical protein